MKDAVKAALGSLAVYLLPVVGPHVVLPWGFILFAELTSESYRRETAWILCDVGLALALQGAVFALILVFLRYRFVLVRLLVVGAVPCLFVALQWLYLIAIPERFLVEADTAPENASFDVACEVENAWVAPVHDAGIWVVSGDDAWGKLALPGCEVVPRGIATTETSGANVAVTPEGAMLWLRIEPPDARPSVQFLAAGEAEPVTIALPLEHETYWNPTLAADGSAIAWMTRRRVDDVLEHEVVMRALPSGEETAFVLRGAFPASLRIVRFDPAASELFLVSDDAVMAVDVEGRLTWGPEAIEANGGILRHPTGFVAWDIYRDEGRYRVEWSLELGEGRHEIPKGRGVTSVALDRGGRFIAVSVSTNLSIGDVPDSVYVLRVDSGEEVYRRYLPAYTRSQLAFETARFLAWTRRDGGVPIVEVLRLPD